MKKNQQRNQPYIRRSVSFQYIYLTEYKQLKQLNLSLEFFLLNINWKNKKQKQKKMKKM